MTSFGLALPQRGALFGATTIPEVLVLARQADASGVFDSVWVGDSLGAKPRPDSLTLLGAVSAVTTRVRLGVGCMASFPVRDPMVFAYQWATLDQLSAGRMVLAACTGIVMGGASAAEGRPFGVRDVQRAARLEENIEICRLLWSQENASYTGRFRSFENSTVEPRPLQDPCPIWIAANPFGASRERALRRVAEKADGWMTVQLFPGMAGSLWDELSRYLAERGRAIETFPRIAYHNLNIADDRVRALEETRRFLDAYYGPVYTDGMVESWTAVGPPAQCAADIAALVDAGMTAVALRITSWDQRSQFDRLVSEVLPLLAR